MKSPFRIAPLLFLQFVNLTWALPWDPPTCPLPAPPAPPAQRLLSPHADGNNTGKGTDFAVTRVMTLLLPRQTSSTCQTVTCNSLYYCCNDQTCTYSSAQSQWGCLWATRTLTVTSTFRSTSTSTSTTTLTITATTSDTSTFWAFASSIDVWTTTVVETSTATETSSVTGPIMLTRRGMPTPTRCVPRPEGEEERRRRGLTKRADFTYYITRTVTITETPASTYYLTTTRLTTYWVTRLWATTRTSFLHVGRTSTLTLTSTATATAIVTGATTVSRGGLSAGAKVGAGVGGGVGGAAVIVIVVFLIWKKCMRPTEEEEWAGNQPVEDSSGNAGPGNGAAGMMPAAAAADKSYQEQYRASYYHQNQDSVMTETPSSPPPPPPPAMYFQPNQPPGQHLERYSELGPNFIHTIPRRPIPGSPAPPSYRGSTGTEGGM